MKTRILSGSTCRPLTQKICKILSVDETAVASSVFSNGNRSVMIQDSLQGDNVFIFQTQADSVDASLMELVMIIRAARESFAKQITAVLPYLPYSRSDKKWAPGAPVTARLVADMLQMAGADRVVAIDIHSPQVAGFFSVPFLEIRTKSLLSDYLKNQWDLTNYCVVAADAGAMKKAGEFAQALSLPLAILAKNRTGPDGQVTMDGLMGDVRGKSCMLVDDETSSGSTLVQAAEFLLTEAGAESVDACFAHAALSEEGRNKLNQSRIRRFITTDTIPEGSRGLRDCEVVSVAPLIAEVINSTL